MVYSIIYPFLILLYLISLFVPSPFIQYAVGAVSIIVIVIASIGARGLYFYTGLTFLISGIFLFITNGLPWHAFLLQFQSMLGLLSLFLVLPFIKFIIYIDQFDKTIARLLRYKIKYWDHLYKRSTFANQLIANFLNIATIPLIIKSLRPSLAGLPNKAQYSFSSKSILRSYALALSWSPLDATVSSSIELTGASFLIVLPIMLCVALGFVFADMGLSYLRYRKVSFTPIAVVNSVSPNMLRRKIAKLSLFILIFVGLASLVEQTLELSFLLSVVFVLPVYSILWSLILKKKGRYFVLIAGNWKNHTHGLSNYFFMFLSAGLFVKMISSTGGILELQAFFERFIDTPVYFYLLTAVFFLIASICGFHPIVALTVFAAIIHSMMNQLSVIPFTVVLVACSMSTVMYSPFNLSVSLLAKEPGERFNDSFQAGGFPVYSLLWSIASVNESNL